MGRQFVDAGKTEDVFIPVFTFLQFFFYMGWLKVGATIKALVCFIDHLCVHVCLIVYMYANKYNSCP